jgi:Zn-dependent protease/CBS domain-containing protein
MKWSWKVGTIRGIALYIHATFLLLLGWIVLSHLLLGHVRMAVEGVAFTLLLFGCVVLHELGHALVAQRLGVKTRDITLYPIGGVAQLERIPREPRQELLIAIAGPLVNLGLAGLIFVALVVTGARAGFVPVPVVGGDLLYKLLWVNLVLAAFNLLPAFPMDGGRVLRAFLAMRMDYGRATQVAAVTGQAMAFVFGFVGLFHNPLLVFVAFFIYMGAAQEAATVQSELAFRGVPVRAAMITRFVTLAPTDPISLAVHQLLAGSQHDFPVVEEGRVVGLLPRTAIVAALGERGPDSLVREAMLPAPLVVSPVDSLEDVFRRLNETEAQTLVVEDEGQLIGLVTVENIGEYLMLQVAGSSSRRPYDPSHVRDGEFADQPVGEQYGLSSGTRRRARI